MDVNKGLYLDGTYLDKPDGAFIKSSNIVKSKSKQGSINEPGFEYKDKTIHPIIGVLETPDLAVLFSTNDNISEIGIFQNEVYTPVIRTLYLGFKRTNPIKAAYTYNYLGDLIVAWCDGIENSSNEIKILNLTNLPFELNINLELIYPDKIRLCYLFLDVSNIKIDLNSLNDGGGSLKSGVYYCAVAYKTDDGIITEFSSTSNPIVIYRDNINQSYDTAEGIVSGEFTNKSFNITISELSSLYSYIVVAVIYKVSGNLFCRITDKIEYIGTSKLVNISNYDVLYDFDISKVISNNQIYPKCNDITSSYDKLLLSDLIGIPNINIIGQEIANDVIIKWTSESINFEDNVITNTFKHPHKIFYDKGFRHDEVYALYLGLKYIKGGYLGIWHIPGRKALAGETDIINTSNLENINPGKIRRFQVQDLSNSDGTMGYWENQNEIYPTGFPDFQGEKVRHHKFPSLNKRVSFTQINTLLFNYPFNHNTRLISTCYGGILFSTSTPPTITNVVWEHINESGFPIPSRTNVKMVVTANKRFSLKINVLLSTARPPVGNCNMQEDETSAHVYFSIDHIRPTMFHNVLFNRYSISSHTINKPTAIVDDFVISDIEMLAGDELHFFVMGNYHGDGHISTHCYFSGGVTIMEHLIDSARLNSHILGIDVSNVVIPQTIQNIVGGWEIFYAKRTIDNSIINSQSILIKDEWFTSPNGNLSVNDRLRFHPFDLMLTKMDVGNANYISGQLLLPARIENVYDVRDYSGNSLSVPFLSTLRKEEFGNIYLPVNNMFVNNSRREGALVLYINNDFGNTSNTSYLLANLCAYKEDCYVNFANQILASVGRVVNRNITSSILFGGDTFISRYSFRCTVQNGSGFAARIFYILCETSNNSDLRFEGNLPEHKFYPKSTHTVISAIDFEYDNFINTETGLGYNYDFTSLNDIQRQLVNKISDRYADKFFNRIAISLPQRSESLEMSWRSFKPGSYYDMKVDRGRIVLMISIGNKLYIQQEFSLSIAFPKEVITGLDQQAFLKEEDIFDRRPSEVFDSREGHIGCINKFHAIITPYGYVVLDLIKQKIFLIADTVIEISAVNAKEWFRKRLIPLSTYNSFTNEGIFFSYDDLHHRVLIFYKNNINNLSFALSFDFDMSVWYSFHSYIPDYKFKIRSELYYIKNYAHNLNHIFKSNSINKEGRYLSDNPQSEYSLDEIYPSSVDIILNKHPEISKLIQNVYWQTVVTDSNGIVRYDDTFNKLMVYNENQCTGLLDINIERMWYNTEYGVYINDIWYFNNIDDVVVNDKLPIFDSDGNIITSNVRKNLKNWFELSKFICKFIVVKLIYDNINKRSILIRSIDATMIRDNR